MTSLIDVIFLLLLFFMLTSTFSKYAEIELSGAGYAVAAASDQPPLFLQLGAGTLRLNGDPLNLARLDTSALSQARAGTVLLVSLGEGVTAQRLTDLLNALRGFSTLNVSVLGS
jgi:biopolymer transport protein ExbD